MKRNIFKEETVVWSCQYHVVWCPKYRRKVLIGKIKERLEELIKEKQQEYMYNVLEMEIMPDHVHLLVEVSPKVGIYPVITKIKGYTSHSLRAEYPELKSKLPSLWTLSKFIGTCGSVSLRTVKNYIQSQKRSEPRSHPNA